MNTTIQPSTKVNRDLKLYIPLLLLIFALGSSTRMTTNLPWWVIQYAGDFLWAMMVFFLYCLVFRLETGKALLIALVTTYLIEITQLFHPPWLETLRSYKLFALIFGYSFLWVDILIYTLGISLGALIDRLILMRR